MNKYFVLAFVMVTSAQVVATEEVNTPTIITTETTEVTTQTTATEVVATDVTTAA